MGEDLSTLLFHLFFSFCSIVTQNVNRVVLREQIIYPVMLMVHIVCINGRKPSHIFVWPFLFALLWHITFTGAYSGNRSFAVLCFHVFLVADTDSVHTFGRAPVYIYFLFLFFIQTKYSTANILLHLAFIQMQHIDAFSKNVMHFFARADIDDTS